LCGITCSEQPCRWNNSAKFSDGHPTSHTSLHQSLRTHPLGFVGSFPCFLELFFENRNLFLHTTALGFPLFHGILMFALEPGTEALGFLQLLIELALQFG